jgi:thioesterase domain-containing protein
VFVWEHEDEDDQLALLSFDSRYHALMAHDSRQPCQSKCSSASLSDMRLRTPGGPHKTAGHSSGGLEVVEDALASLDPESFV